MTDTPTTTANARPSDVRAFFESPGFAEMTSDNGKNVVFTDGPATPSALKAREIMDLKKADPDGYDAIARGIKDGTFTYED